MKSGIYKISFNNETKIYIGSSKNISNRFKEHIRKLKSNNHANQYLQKAWNKYGEQLFDFQIVRLCKESLLLKYEQYFINKSIIIYGWENMYNITPTAGSNRGYIRKKESNEKQAEKMRGRKSSLETKKKLSEIKKGHKQSEDWIRKRINNHIGSKRSEETKLKMSKAWKNRVVSEETKRKIGEAVRKRGISPEHRAKINASKRKNMQKIYEYS